LYVVNARCERTSDSEEYWCDALNSLAVGQTATRTRVLLRSNNKLARCTAVSHDFGVEFLRGYALSQARVCLCTAGTSENNTDAIKINKHSIERLNC